MKAASQTVIILMSFVTVSILGGAMDTAFWQAGYHAKHFLYGKPLPTLTQFFIDHHDLVIYVTLLPWLWLVGAPLLTLRAASSYWDTASFALRYLAFLACETTLFATLLLGLFLPFVTYYGVLQSGQSSLLDTAIPSVFWLGAVTTALTGLYRFYQLCRRRPGDR